LKDIHLGKIRKIIFIQRNLILTTLGRINTIIHTASAVGAGMAQIPGSDSVAIVPIQIAMINGIAHEHGCGIDRSAAMSIIGTQGATMVGRKISQVLVGWIPGPGNAINASTAAGVTEAVGWSAHAYFKDKKQIEGKK